MPFEVFWFYILSAILVGFVYGGIELPSIREALFVGLFWPVCLLWALYQGAKEFFRAD